MDFLVITTPMTTLETRFPNIYFSLFDHGETTVRVYVSQPLPLERVTSQEFPTQTFLYGYQYIGDSLYSPHGSQHGSQHGTQHEP